MSGRGAGILTRDFEVLFGVGTLAGLTDAQLLKQFTQCRNESAQAAFATLVARHGPMVFRVCGATLQDLNDIEDAFQATFLILACRARSIRDPGSVGSWLFGVARRTAANARLSAIRRRKHEQRRAALAMRPLAEEDRNELESALWDEVARLPEKYRAPVVICYMEGLTHEAAAQHLGWPVGTVEGRLARARGLLRTRLTRRGLAPAVGLLVGSSSAQAAPLVVSDALAGSTAKVAMAFAAGRTATINNVSVRVAGLAELVLATTSPITIKAAVAAIAMVVLTVVCAGSFNFMAPYPLDQPGKGKSKTAPPPVKNARVLVLMGQQFTWEYRFIARALAKDPNIRFEAIVVRKPAREGKGQLDDAEFQPGRYDVFVLDDLSANDLTLRQQGMLATAVERGAGMIMLGGQFSFGAGGWARTEVARIMPMELHPDDGMNEVKGGLKFQPTELGFASWILQLGPTRAETIKNWSKLPPFSQANRFGTLKGSALILATTADREPLLIVRDVGKGRVMAFGGQTWTWARSSDESKTLHRKFWRRALLWTGQIDPPPE